MTVHVLSGLRPEPLASYLAGIGLLRVLAEQRDAGCRAWWGANGLHLDTEVSDVTAWLVEEYVPTPVLSPWNEGSGFGAKDKAPKKALEDLRKRSTLRLDGFRLALEVARQVGDVSRRMGWGKSRTVREYRNRCPDELVPWIDASVVLASQQAYFPPLLGTGGNDGRLDFSTNFHQRLLDVIVEQPGETSTTWAWDALQGTHGARLQAAAVGQFDPGGAGGKNSSPHGEADSLVNPWSFVLLVEGLLLFAAGVARRLGHTVGSASMPFTLRSSMHGTERGASDEQSRGEVWAPVWAKPFSYSEVRQLFDEARASWRGRPAQQAVEMYESVMSHGVARGVDRYVRYGLHQRNGLAFVAVPLDHVRVQPRADVRLAAQLEEWPARVRRAATRSSAVESALRRFDAAHLDFARSRRSEGLMSLLERLTKLELAVARSGRLREDLPVRRPPKAQAFLDEIVAVDGESPELRVAVGLASLASAPGDVPARTLRQLLLPIEPEGRGLRWRDSSVVTGFPIRPLVSVLSDVLVWRGRHTVDEHTDLAFRGVRTFPFGIRIPAGDLHNWATGRLEESRISAILTAMLALDWYGVSVTWTGAAPFVPVLVLGLLHPFADGFPTVPSRTDAPAPHDVPRLGLNAEWPTLLRANRVDDVHLAAVHRLGQAGWQAAPSAVPQLVAGERLAAALLPRCRGSLGVLRGLADRIVTRDETDAVTAFIGQEPIAERIAP